MTEVQNKKKVFQAWPSKENMNEAGIGYRDRLDRSDFKASARFLGERQVRGMLIRILKLQEEDKWEEYMLVRIATEEEEASGDYNLDTSDGERLVILTTRNYKIWWDTLAKAQTMLARYVRRPEKFF